MTFNDAGNIGKVIRQHSKDISMLKQNINPDDPYAQLFVPFSEQLRITGNIEIYQRRMEGVFIVGHPVYGQILIDGGLSMPVLLPATFEPEIGYQIGPICILDHPFWAFLNDCILGDRDADQYERTLIFEGEL